MQLHPFEEQGPEPQTSAPCLPLVASSPPLLAAVQPLYPHSRQRYGAVPTAPLRQHLLPHSSQPNNLSDRSSHSNHTATTTADTATAATTATTTATIMITPLSGDDRGFHRPMPYLCDPMEEQMRKNNIFFQEAVQWARILDGFSFMDSTTGDNEDELPRSLSSPPLRPPIQRLSSCRSSGTSLAVKTSTVNVEESYPRAPTLTRRKYWFCGVNTQWDRQRGPTIRAMIHATREHGWQAAVEKIGAAFFIGKYTH